MDFLNKAYAQLSELFATMSMGARVIAGLLLTIVVVSLSYLFTHQVSNPDEYLLGARVFTNSEIAAATSAFAKEGLANWDTEGNRLRVPRSMKHIYLAALAEHGALPKDAFQFINEAVKDNSIWRSQKQHQDALKIGQQQQLSFIIRQMNGIDDAWVTFDEKIEGTFPKTKTITASASVWPTKGFHFSDQQVDSIRQLVANSIGADPKSVGVIDIATGKRRSNDLDEDGNISNLYQRTKENLEAHFADKARETLSYIRDVIVKVNVDLDDTSHYISKMRQFDLENSVPVRTNKTTDNELKTTINPIGEPGTVPNGPNAPTEVSSASTDKSTRDKKSTNIETIPAESIVEQRKVPMTPKKVTATVAVPKSYYREVWRQQNPIRKGEDPRTPSEQELKNLETKLNAQIQNAVVNVLPPKPEGADKWEPVVVIPFELIPEEKPAGPPVTAATMSWLSQNWSTLGMMFMGAFSLIMLRSMVRSIPGTTSTATAAAPSPVEGSPSLGVVSADDEDDGEEDSPEKVLQRSMSGPNLRDELVELVHDDPDAAAKVVSSWIGNVG